jgi:hypothetical protein
MAAVRERRRLVEKPPAGCDAAVGPWLVALDAADLARVRALERRDVSPGWVPHHLLQHGAEHRGAIAALAGRAER